MERFVAVMFRGQRITCHRNAGFTEDVACHMICRRRSIKPGDEYTGALTRRLCPAGVGPSASTQLEFCSTTNDHIMVARWSPGIVGGVRFPLW